MATPELANGSPEEKGKAPEQTDKTKQGPEKKKPDEDKQKAEEAEAAKKKEEEEKKKAEEEKKKAEEEKKKAEEEAKRKTQAALAQQKEEATTQGADSGTGGETSPPVEVSPRPVLALNEELDWSPWGSLSRMWSDITGATQKVDKVPAPSYSLLSKVVDFFAPADKIVDGAVDGVKGMKPGASVAKGIDNTLSALNPFNRRIFGGGEDKKES